MFKIQGLHSYKHSSNWNENADDNVLRSSCAATVILLSCISNYNFSTQFAYSSRCDVARISIELKAR
jgi:hypothetical protein